MLDLAKHIVESKSGHFEPAKFEDRYEAALQELLDKKQKGQPIVTAKRAAPSNVFNLMDALKASIKGDKGPAAADKPSRKTRAKAAAKRKAADGQERTMEEEEDRRLLNCGMPDVLPFRSPTH
ncbi:hypothetical protein JQ609_34800 [Bradyrhizobium sp. AUGA SZCCT0169]|uniref:hypothetical protein n=1 Tax=unclassified Bradyrhizobium TaxID=2631580 RepID=UPI001BA4ECD5|nr:MULTISPECIES: hypothetical protein [unclassified Bradyrhizobium]MBR1194375.1 hypothetical protein [Bradyrhizobium sp. AUGA SZCCT0160]MBR1252072.1 hypothetical protein [Bradyrhizobium sp. AUGA SZCCT0169]